MSGPLSLAVIGCGVIGSRHAQALGLLDRPANIYLIDPSDAARAQAANLCRAGMQMSGRKELIDARDITTLPESLDVAIVATGAAERPAAIASLYETRRIAYLILEKFLFQREADYSDIAGRLAVEKSKAWVNCPRRLWPGYQKLRSMLHVDNSAVMLNCSTHSKFGIGTSAIHLLDTLAYLSGRTDFTLMGDRLDDELLQGKRGGIEVTGQLYGFSAHNDFFSFTAHKKGSLPTITMVETAACRAIVDDAAKVMRVSHVDDDWRWVDMPFDTMLQSEMTHHIVSDLLDTGGCGLPSMAESSRLHLAILQPLLSHYRQLAEPSANACPIT